MRILRHYRDAPPEARGAVVALGNFDGVHRGHQALIGEARRLAAEGNLPLAALVFEPYPREFFRPTEGPFRLTSFRAKAQLLAALGVETLFVLAFDAEMAGMAAQDFVLGVLKDGLSVAHVVIGADFRFGKGRSGDAAVLAYMGEMEDFGVTSFAPVMADGEKISSSQIRAALRTGQTEQAARLLGHWWSIEGHVASGDRRGRTIGYPTANIRLERNLHPAHGIYAVRVRMPDGTSRDGVASFGLRPMFALPVPLMEVHIFDFAGDLYGELLGVELVAYLRAEENFASLEALKAQIGADAAQARALLAAAPAIPVLDPSPRGLLGNSPIP